MGKTRLTILVLIEDIEQSEMVPIRNGQHPLCSIGFFLVLVWSKPNIGDWGDGMSSISDTYRRHHLPESIATMVKISRLQ